MGGVAATVPLSDPSATIANPGQVGLFSLENLLSVSSYSPRTQLFPSLNMGLTMAVTSFNAGYNLTDILSLPFSAGVGVGYSRTYIDRGTLLFTNASGPQPIGSASFGNDTYENYSVGLGLEYYARLGIGMNFKRITSRLTNFNNFPALDYVVATPSATDFGILLTVPIFGVASQISGTSFTISDRVCPFLDLSGSYVKANVGDPVSYVDPAQGDPLPRSAVIGLNVEAGFSAKAGSADWRLISLGLTHQAEDILVIPHDDGTYGYKGGLGDLSIGDNVISGKATGYVLVRKGWEVGLGEFLYFRGGSVFGDGYDYETSGYSVCLGGLVRSIEYAYPKAAESSLILFIGNHIDLQYHSARYTSQSTSWDGTTFKELSLVVRGIPW